MHQNWTIILAAGKRDPRNTSYGLTSSDALTLVNGRPVILWILKEYIENKNNNIIFICNDNDLDFKNFFKKRWQNQDNLHIIPLKNPKTILHSTEAALKKIFETSHSVDNIRLMLGDTILKNVEFSDEDAVYVADFEHDSRSWCVVSLSSDNKILFFKDKVPNLRSPEYKALVGRYEFKDATLFYKSVQNALEQNKSELSAALQLYHAKKKLAARVIPNASWIDCGHLEGVAMARNKLIESRYFNELEINPILPEIIKRSPEKKKILQEVFWYSHLPERLQCLAPRIIDVDQAGENQQVVMEYYGYGNLAEKFIYYDLPHNFWEFVLDKLFNLVKLFKSEFKENFTSYKDDLNKIDVENMYVLKINERIEELKSQDKFWKNALSLDYIYVNDKKYKNIPLILDSAFVKAKEMSQNATISIMHGDLCFNNILFDIGTGVIKLIDPRGRFGTDVFSILGDARYDIAKLRHSYCGNYDCLIENEFQLEEHSENNFTFRIYKEKQIEREVQFDRLTEKHGYSFSEIRFIEALLFLTMIPLHQDSLKRQTAMWLNAIIKLNRELDGM